MSNEQYIEKYRGCSDPCVSWRNGSPVIPSTVHRLGPPATHLIV